MAEKASEYYNKATDKHLASLHNKKSEAGGKSTGRETPSTGGKKNFETWTEDLFEE
jgi:hypothetical protein